MNDLYTLLRTQSYAGRGIIIGTTPSGRSVFAYFIMGRSASSRARRFTESGEDIVIKNIGGDPQHPELILYAPVRKLDGRTIVTNGDQTDTIYEALRLGGSFESALMTRAFEPDPPHFTSRISCLTEPCGSYALSILKPADREGSVCVREFFRYERQPCHGHYIHTYAGTEHTAQGDVLTPFAGEPYEVNIPDDLREFADLVWNGINEENKVALAVRDMQSGETIIINKY